MEEIKQQQKQLLFKSTISIKTHDSVYCSHFPRCTLHVFLTGRQAAL